MIEPEVSALAAELAAGRPVLILQNFGAAHYPIWHYAVVIGFDAAGDEMVLRSGRNYRKTLRFARGHGAILGPSYRAALARWPQSDVARLGLGNAHYARGDFDQAERQYRRLLTEHPDHAAARNNLAQVLADRGCHEAALSEIEAALAVVAESELKAALVRTQKELLQARTASTGGSAHCLRP